MQQWFDSYIYRKKERKTTEIARIDFPQDLGKHVDADILL